MGLRSEQLQGVRIIGHFIDPAQFPSPLGRGSIDLPFVPDRFFIKMPALRIKEGFRE
jgi:hypothetical protein